MKNSNAPRGSDNSITLQAGPPSVDAEASPSPVSATPIAATTVAPTIVQSQSPTPIEIIDPAEPAPDDTRADEVIAPISEAEATMLALTPPQRAAIQLLTSGHTLVDSATAAGVSRMTLYRWLKGDAAFSAAFNAWQKDVLDTARGRLLALTDIAVTTVAKSMSRGDAKTALKILGSVGLLDRAQPGSTDPDEVRRLQDVERQKAKTALKRAENRAEMDSFLPV